MINHEDAVLIDVRSAEDYAKGHIVNARNIPLDQLESRVKELEKAKRKPLIVHCERGNRSRRAEAILKGKGFEKVYGLAGGIEAWRQAGLPLEKS